MSSRLETLLSLHAGDPDDSFVTYALAKEYESLERLDLSLEIFTQLKEKDPAYVGLYYHLGKLYESLDRPQDALITYAEGIDIGKRQADFHAVSELSNAKMNLELEM
jgi:tetratricopeptide (TPR) repeat protein